MIYIPISLPSAGYTLESDFEQIESKLNIAINSHFGKLHLQGLDREEKIFKELIKLLTSLISN